MIFAGIDPGLTGALAAIRQDGELVFLEELPVIRSGKLAWIDAPELLRMLKGIEGLSRVTIERAQAMPAGLQGRKQGAASTFQTGVTMGSIVSTVQLAGVRMELVQANIWKMAMGLTRDKDASRDKASLLFPSANLSRKKDHNLAEALLIAEWSRRKPYEAAA